jgi:cell division topological specificity factor
MTGWIEHLVPGNKKSATMAKERLKLVLIHDRTDISPKNLEIMKNELLEVISHHIDIDPDSVQIAMTQDGREQRLIADIPLKTTQRRKIG